MTDRTASVRGLPTSEVLQTNKDVVPRRRAAVACRVCNLRKVRCNVAATGRPCSNCALDGVDCELPPRKGRRARAATVDQNSTPTSESGNRMRDAQTTQRVPQEQLLSPHHQVVTPLQARNSVDSRSLISSDESRATPTTSSTEPLAAALDFSDALAKQRESLFYSGSHHRGTLDQASDDQTGSYLPAARYLVSYSTSQSKSEADATYLRAKGVFVLPSPSVYDRLVVTFFHYVYPFVPVVDANQFLEVYTTQGYSAPSTLLLWSMFVAATNHVGAEIIQEAGYESRTTMKTSYFEKAKIAFDHSIEENPITILQSVTILGYGVINLQDQFDDWHWMGVAISMCFNLRIHRFTNPPTATAKDTMKLAQYNLRVRIWWSCVARDRFLALVRSRPVRIDLQCSDIPLPEGIQELSQELRAVSENLRLKYLPFDLLELGNLWGRYIRSGVILGKIMRLRAENLTSNEGDNIENELLAISPPTAVMNESWQMCQRTIHLVVKLIHGALVILFHQPLVLKAAVASQPTDSDRRTRRAMLQSTEAASAMDVAMQELMRLDLLRKMMPMFLTMLIPAMQIHLLDSISANSTKSRLGNHNLDLYMMVLSELKDDYWGAELAFQIFNRARTKSSKSLKASDGVTTTSPMDSASSASLPVTGSAPVGLNDPLFDWDDPNGIFSSLFDNFELNSLLGDGWPDS